VIRWGDKLQDLFTRTIRRNIIDANQA